MFVYIKNNKIIHQSSDIKPLTGFLEGCTMYKTEHREGDRLIYENGRVMLYETTKQYQEDQEWYMKDIEIQKLNKEKDELQVIADKKVAEDLEVKENNKLNQKLYLLKNLGKG